MHMLKETKEKLKNLLELKNPYQLSKELNLSKTTLYRVFPEINVREVKFDTILKLITYYDKLENQKRTNNLFSLRNEKIYLINKLIHQPLLWTGRVTSNLFDFTDLQNQKLNQPNIELTNIEYEIFKFIPNLSNIKEGSDFSVYGIYTSEIIEKRESNEDGSLLVSIGVKTTNEEIEKVICSDYFIDVEFPKELKSYHKEVEYILYVIKKLICVYLEHKVAAYEDYDFSVLVPREIKEPIKLPRRYESDEIEDINFNNMMFSSATDIVIDFEYLIEGKPYNSSVVKILLEEHDFSLNEGVMFSPTLELHKYDDEVLILFKSSFLNETNSTQLLFKGVLDENELLKLQQSLNHLCSILDEELLDSVDETYNFEKVVIKNYIL